MTGYLPMDWCIFIEILKWTGTKQWRCSYRLRHEGQIVDKFKKILSIKVIKIVLHSMLYETLKWPQIAPFCLLSTTKSLPLSRIMACTLRSLSYAPGNAIMQVFITNFPVAKVLCLFRNITLNLNSHISLYL